MYREGKMSKRNLRPIYAHNGYTLRPAKVLSTGVELLHCTERKTTVSCGAMGYRETDGSISLVKPHAGHEPDDGKVQSKFAKAKIKSIAQTTQLAPRDIFHEAKMKFGARSVVVAGSVSTLSRLISRQREEKCLDTEAVAQNPVFQGKMTKDNDGETFLLFDDLCPQTNTRHVGFGSQLGLQVLEKSSIVISDGTFEVVQQPFKQIWCIHAQFGDTILPVVHVLMSSRAVADYEFVLQKILSLIPTWAPSDYLGDLEIGQSKAFTTVFPNIRRGFCYFHLLQAWFRKLKELKLDGLVSYGNSMNEFWSILKCLPFGDLTNVIQDFTDLWNLIPQPVTFQMETFKNYMLRNYIGSLQRNSVFSPIMWNVVSRSVRRIPRTTNTVESSHRNYERCIMCTRGRSSPLLSEILKCLRQEASKLKFDKETLDIDPSYKVSSQRKLKDEMKDARILNALNNPQGLQGVQFLKSMRAARKYT